MPQHTVIMVFDGSNAASLCINVIAKKNLLADIRDFKVAKIFFSYFYCFDLP